MFLKRPKAVWALFAISFLFTFNYYLLKTVKDALFVTAESAGAEVIPFVKMWCLLPVSFILSFGFAWLSSRRSLSFAFKTTLSFFLFTFALFGFFLFPNREWLHPHALADQMQHHLPPGWSGMAAIVRYWTYALFYVMAESWSSIVYSVMFWGFANEMISFSDAKKHYPLLTLAGTVAALGAGPLAIIFSTDSMKSWFPFGTTPWEQTLYLIILTILLNGLLAYFIFAKVFPSLPSAPTKTKTPFLQSLRHLLSSRYLLTLALITLSFNLTFNIVDVVWKNEILKLYPNPSEYHIYLNYVTIATGIFSTLLTLFVTSRSLHSIGWTKTAILPPAVALVTGVFFFGFLIYGPLALGVFFGSLHICVSLSGKYTLFDTSKELSFLTLTSEEKLNAKAAIDGVGTRLGKGGGSLIFQFLLMFLPSVSACIPYVGSFLTVALILCMLSVLALGRQMKQRIQPPLAVD